MSGSLRRTPFQTHMEHFASSSSPNEISLLSSLRGSLSLGLNLPASLALALGLRVLYAPFPHYLRPVRIDSITPSASRSQLEHASIPETSNSSFSRTDLLTLYTSSTASHRRSGLQSLLDRMHVWSFWAMAADTKTGRVDAADVRRFQKGNWEDAVVQRRKSRVPGKGDILPFVRGGPLGVAAHSWAVHNLFGVKVYRDD
ncbi:hypothetical protein BCR39DRAFT_561779 [Naematelia encephala]|uniref:Uncharacterized protein n=1 Tax=Naematelia encephala TaxID=71784 RepID=A0A1Y2ANR7_9TREE|nr:hypothetical protein BCR39DRAFT_561779 [Naematelia encephala]